MKINLQILTILLFQSNLCQAGEPFWRPAAQHLGGTVNQVALNQQEELIISTNIGVIRFKDRSQWQPLTSHIDSLPINVLAVGKDNTVYMATPYGKLYYLRDGETIWTPINLQVLKPTSIVTPRAGSLYVADGKLVYHSSDNGKTWNTIIKGIDSLSVQDNEFGETPESLKVRALCYDSLGTIFLGTNGYGVYRMNIEDSLWRETKSGDLISYSSSREIISLCTTPDGFVYAGTDEGIFRLGPRNEDEWQQINSSPGSINCLAIKPNGIIYAGTDEGVICSIDSGKTWKNSPMNLSCTSVNSITIDHHGRIYIGTDDSGVFESDDAGLTYQQIGIPTDDSISVRSLGADSRGNIYSTWSEHGVYRLSPNDSCWRRVLDGRGAEGGNWAIGNDRNGNILLGSFYGSIILSLDSGAIWQRIGRYFGTIRCITVNHQGELFLGDAGGVAMSYDNGATWKRLLLPWGVGVDHISFDTNGNIYAAGDTGPLISSDNGITWIYLRKRIENLTSYPNQFFGQLILNCFGFDSKNNPLACTVGIYRSTDSGRSWIRCFSLTDELVTELVKTQRGIFYAATQKSGVFISSDDGNNWQAINSGLLNTRLNCMVLSPTGYLFVGTNGNDVFRSIKQVSISNDR